MIKEKRIWHKIKIYCGYDKFNEFDRMMPIRYGRGIGYKPEEKFIFVSTSSYTYVEMLENWLQDENIQYEKRKFTYDEFIKQGEW